MAGVKFSNSGGGGDEDRDSQGWQIRVSKYSFPLSLSYSCAANGPCHVGERRERKNSLWLALPVKPVFFSLLGRERERGPLIKSKRGRSGESNVLLSQDHHRTAGVFATSQRAPDLMGCCRIATSAGLRPGAMPHGVRLCPLFFGSSRLIKPVRSHYLHLAREMCERQLYGPSTSCCISKQKSKAARQVRPALPVQAADGRGLWAGCDMALSHLKF
jgi:hypothetical protein